MKISIIGAGGVRTPLLVNGLTRSDLPIDEIGLFDTDPDRLAIIGSLAASLASSVRIYADARRCVSDAAFVFLSIRAGGIASRAADEAAAVAQGIVGQETIGPAGFAMAMRNAPRAVEYAHLIADETPTAWVINFTNPVGIVTQAMTTRAPGARVIGICDTPTELFEDVAHVLGIDSARCWFDYFGLNHLGWLREVFCDGEPQLAGLWEQPDLLERVYRAPLFDPAFLQTLRLLPTEYLFYYYAPQAALDNMKRAGQTRGAAIAEMNDQLFHDLAAAADRRAVYDRYLATRNASYMQIESGAAHPVARSPWAALTGYDRIALSVIQAIHFNTNAVIPLNVLNRGAIRELDDDDCVEVPCIVSANGGKPLQVGRVPDASRDLLVRVKEYERLTVAAASTGLIDDAVRALTANPLVGDPGLARRLVNALKIGVARR